MEEEKEAKEQAGTHEEEEEDEVNLKTTLLTEAKTEAPARKRKANWLNFGTTSASSLIALIVALLLFYSASFWPRDDSASIYKIVDLRPVFNNQGVAKGIEQLDRGSFDGNGESFAAEGFPTGKIYVGDTLFQLQHSYGEPAFDNLKCNGTVIALPKGRYYALKLLAASDVNRLSVDIQIPGDFVFKYTDGKTFTYNALVPQWQNWQYLHNSAIVGPYSWTKEGKVGGPMLKDGTSPQNRTQIHSLEIPLPYTDSELESVTVPFIKPRIISYLESAMIPSSNHDPAWHIFAATLVTTPALQNESQKQFFVESVQFTQRWDDIDGKRFQFVEVVVVNTPSQGNATRPITMEVHSRSAKTLNPTKVTRLPKSNFIRVDVPITGGNGAKERATVTIRDANSGEWLTISPGWLVQPGLTDYDSSDASLSRIQAPNWWRDAKLGIMFLFGPYSVPAYGVDFYAEWYMHDMSTNNNTKAYHLKTYGEQFLYDDFFDKFTAAKFDASEWVALMEASGARYSVGTTKHHDGFALFDTKETSNRNSLKYGPKRDLMKELMLAAQNSTVRFGTYFSPVEWYNPIQNPYGFELFVGGPYRNAYTGEAVPYTGFIEKDDFIDDIQSPQQQILMEDYRTNIMWCDIGGPSRGCQNAAKWYNEARKRGQNVVMNNRCGCLWNGFGTPEYATYSGTVQNLWETNEGLAPFSFGFNAQDAPSAYKTPEQLVTMLVDVVSKNGNYLINFGPEASGVIPKAQQNSLLGMGKWLKTNGEAIYGTHYWNLTPQEGDWRFTTKDGFFFMISLTKPSTSYTFTSPIPIQDGDVITLLGAKGAVKYTIDEKGLLTINPTSTQIGQGSLAWAFRIEQK